MMQLLRRLAPGRKTRVEPQPTRRQPVPNVTDDDVERVVWREFSTGQFAAVMAILHEYGTEQQREAARVRLAALKLAKGNPEKLRANIQSAKRDYRDVLAYAEYPEYSKKGFGVRQLPVEEQRRIIDSDWRQYEEWLTK